MVQYYFLSVKLMVQQADHEYKQTCPLPLGLGGAGCLQQINAAGTLY